VLLLSAYGLSVISDRSFKFENFLLRTERMFAIIASQMTRAGCSR